MSKENKNLLFGNDRLEVLEQQNEINPISRVLPAQRLDLHCAGQIHMTAGDPCAVAGYYEEYSEVASLFPKQNIMETLGWNTGQNVLKQHLSTLKREGKIYYSNFKNLLSGDEKVTVTVEYLSPYLWVIALVRFWEKENFIQTLPQGTYYNRRIIETFRKGEQYEEFKLQSLKDKMSKYKDDEHFYEDFLEPFVESFGSNP